MPRYFHNLDASSSLETPAKCLNDDLYDDSGYKGHESTPRHYMKKTIRKARLSFTPHLEAVKEKGSSIINSEDINELLHAVIPYVVTLIIISSILFTLYIGNSERNYTNMK